MSTRECPECRRWAQLGPFVTSVCADCKLLEGMAWCAGFDDAQTGTYDCRRFESFRLFTAYSHGRRTGLMMPTAGEVTA